MTDLECVTPHTVLQIGYTIVENTDMWKIHMIYTCVYVKNTHWYILRIEPESHVVYFAYSQYYHVR